MKLKVFYHLSDRIDRPEVPSELLPGVDIAREQLSLLKSSGLLDNATVYCNLHYNEGNWEKIKQEFDHKNIVWLFKESKKEDREHTTNIFMKEMADNSEEEFYALYLNQKGVSYVEGIHGCAVQCKHWRWIQDYWNISQWENCVKKLDEGFDAVGCLLSNRPPIGFLGTTSWAKSSFIKKCNKLTLPSTNGFKVEVPSNGYGYACDVEYWYGSNNAKMFSFYNTGVDHYAVEWPPERYRK